MLSFARVLIFSAVPEGSVGKEPDSEALTWSGTIAFWQGWGSQVLTARHFSLSFLMLPPFSPLDKLLNCSHLQLLYFCVRDRNICATFPCLLIFTEFVLKFWAEKSEERVANNETAKQSTSCIPCFAPSLISQEKSYSEREVNKTLKTS